jgi:nitroreductase/NAD-dependent dihydropyrimidine dehydrogenase PreA subunit
MGLLRIDESKCKKDGMCVRECPFNIIRLEDDNGFPVILPENDWACIRCGHCVAVCPHGALSHEYIPIEDCPSVEEDLAINERQAVQFLRSRRSARHYKDTPVEIEKLRRLIEVARYAPSASNSQSVEWRVITDKTKIRKIAELTVEWMRQILVSTPQVAHDMPLLPKMIEKWDSGNDIVFWGAPALVVASAPLEALFGTIDVTLALSYLDLVAPTLGLGTCWAGLLQMATTSSTALRETLGIPERHTHYFTLMIGYPTVKRYYRLPERRVPKITIE